MEKIIILTQSAAIVLLVINNIAVLIKMKKMAADIKRLKKTSWIRKKLCQDWIEALKQKEDIYTFETVDSAAEEGKTDEAAEQMQ